MHALYTKILVLSPTLEKHGAVPGWKKQYRRVLEAINMDTHLWHGAGHRDPQALKKILTDGQVNVAHVRPDIQTGNTRIRAPYPGAYFSTNRPNETYWAGGGIGVPKEHIPGEVVYQQPHASVGHEWLSRGPVDVPKRALTTPGYGARPSDYEQLRRLTQERRLRPVHPHALTHALAASNGPSSNAQVTNLEHGVLNALKNTRRAYKTEARDAQQWGREPPAPGVPLSHALSGPPRP